jgi:hypothetical protein
MGRDAVMVVSCLARVGEWESGSVCGRTLLSIFDFFDGG